MHWHHSIVLKARGMEANATRAAIHVHVHVIGLVHMLILTSESVGHWGELLTRVAGWPGRPSQCGDTADGFTRAHSMAYRLHREYSVKSLTTTLHTVMIRASGEPEASFWCPGVEGEPQYGKLKYEQI